MRKKILIIALFVGLFVIMVLGIPYIAKTLDEARKGATKGNRAAILAAVSIYYSENNGKRPVNLDALIPKYIEQIPEEPISKSNKNVTRFDGTGGWYDNPEMLEIKANVKGNVQ
ncbi:MAG: hypothetical protein A2452_00175 [Candidatus Firestonebacteria bacterium RIFOXYC2_FULL_39_67]|nr:MAG: hypothetical protein A2536_05880 [Candidatus Firestonebacteria bacterium RIFOXYD2_FULL_39_29]OGF54224.1 MAG: hypothetical protein A2452_00175 [Candidatus Firestonebacteria bacterium RIFOXYC2_FULL_39_67]